MAEGWLTSCPLLQVNSTPLDAFLIFNLLVFLPLLAIQEALSEDQSLTYVNYLYMHHIVVYVRVECMYKKAEIATVKSLLIVSVGLCRPVQTGKE